MKKVLMSLIVFIMLLTTISFAETKAKVNVEAARIRESASTNSEIVTNVYQDDQVEILEENGEWSKIKYGENVGYTKTQFLTKINSSDENEPTTNEVKNETTSNYTQNDAITNEVNNTTNTESQSVENTVIEENNIEQPTAVTEPEEEQNVIIGESIKAIGNLKIRRIPNFSIKAKEEILEGSDIVIVNILGKWCKISDGTNSGWIVKNKLFSEPNENVVEPEQTTTQENTESTNTVENTTATNTLTENTVNANNVNNATQTNTTSENATTKTGVITVETARVRKTASTNGEIIGTLDENEVVKITGEEGEFYKISTSYIDTGYVSKRLVKEKNVSSRSLNTERVEDIANQNTVSETANLQLTEIFEQQNQEIIEEAVEQPVANTSRKNEVIEFAKQYLGYSYVSGGHAPETGFDCSGFTRYIFGHFGYTLGATAASQTSVGVEVSREELQTADLILYYDEGMTKIGHVGIYIGDGNFIHSANPRRGVVIDNLNTNSYYSKRFVTARRIVD